MVQVTLFYEPEGPRAYLPLVFLGVYAVVFAFCVTLFCQRMDREPIKSRSAALVVAQVSVMFFLNVINSVAIYINSIGYTDAASQLLYWIEEPLWIPFVYVPFVVRSLRLYHMYMRGKLMINDSRISLGLPASLRFAKFHDRAVQVVKPLMSSVGGALFVIVPFLINMAVVTGCYVANDYNYSDAMVAWMVLFGNVYIYVLAFPTVSLVIIASAADVFSIRNEMVILTFAHIPMVVLQQFGLFSMAIYMSVSAFHIYGAWVVLLASIVYPLIHSYRFDTKRELLLKKAVVYRQDPFVARLLLRCFGIPPIADEELFSEILSNESFGCGFDNASPLHTTVTASNATNADDEEIADAIAEHTQGGTTEIELADRRKAANPVGNSRKKAPKIFLSSLINDPEECYRLQKLAVQTFSVELVLFLVDMNKFYNAAEIPHKLELATSVVSLYIYDGAPRQLNLSAQVRSNVEKTFAALCQVAKDGWHRFVYDGHDNALLGMFKETEAEVKVLVQTNILPLWRQNKQQQPFRV